MAAFPRPASRTSAPAVPLGGLARLLSAALPLAVLQPVLGRIAAHVAASRPELFARLGPHTDKHFLIDPTDLSFVLVLRPDAASPYLKAHRRAEAPRHDAAIAGTLVDLMDMIDGVQDGDALFFARDLRVSGDTAAVVALRNALDDFEGSALESAVSALGPFARPAAAAIAALRAIGRRRHHG
jgi:predicted lipid carrier protein YhbT